jgi:hypothetical protein
VSSPIEITAEVLDLLKNASALNVDLRTADLDHAPNVDPPMVVVGPPSWHYRTPGTDPVDYALAVWVVVAETERAMTELMAYVPRVAAVLDEPSGIVVLRAEPTAFPSGSSPLPAYRIDIEVDSS